MFADLPAPKSRNRNAGIVDVLAELGVETVWVVFLEKAIRMCGNTIVFVNRKLWTSLLAFVRE